jgi:peptide/nickel transport system substrate-binding protein
VKFEGDNLTDLKPGLASEWQVTEDGDNWVLTFTLADGGVFASGNPITSADVVYSFQRAIALNKSPSFLWTAVGGLTPESITAPDDKTVVLTMPKTASPAEFLNVLTAPPLSIVDSEVVKTHEAQVDGANDWGNTWLSENSAGSGPYVIDHWTKDVEFLLTANPNAAVQPTVPNILVKHVAEAAVQQAQLEAGDADIAHDLTPEQIAALEASADIATSQAGNLQIFYLGMNAKMAPLDNNNVREAIRYAIDYDGIANQLLSGNAKVLQTVIPDGLMGANTDTIFTRDVEKAKQLLAEAGAEAATIDLLAVDGNLGIVPMPDLAAKLQSDLAEIGITLNVVLQPEAELLATYRAQNAPIVLVRWGPDYPDPNTNAGPFSDYSQNVIAWRNNWEDPQAAEMATAAKLEADPAKRVEMYKELTEYVAHNGPYGVLFQPVQLFAARNNVQGFSWNPMGYVDLWSVSK